MSKNLSFKVCAYSLGILLLFSFPVYAEKIVNPRLKSQTYPEEQIFPQLEQSQVIYLGETHDRMADHQLQLEIIQKLYRQNPKIAIAMEMFQRPAQNILDLYVAGKITETELIEQTEYPKRWGFLWQNYQAILQFAQANQVKVLALNTPSEITRKVARQGLESLTESERKSIPPLTELITDNSAYRQLVLNSFQEHHQNNLGSSASFERFFLAQVLWDETMAETISKFAKINPDYQIIVLAGQMHIVYGFGIPSRVARRFANRKLSQTLILLNSSLNLDSSEQPMADFLWYNIPK